MRIEAASGRVKFALVRGELHELALFVRTGGGLFVSAGRRLPGAHAA